MEYYTLLLLGCLVGMQHALEADHLAAVAAMTTGRTSRKALVLRGSVWGLGHTITLLSICGLLLVFGEAISPRTEGLLELLVGLMLVLLGANVLRTLRTQRVHFHVHEHQGGVRHVHAHSHAQDDREHLRGEHRHGHRELGGQPFRGLEVLEVLCQRVPELCRYVLSFMKIIKLVIIIINILF